jgi:hypothetical protein
VSLAGSFNPTRPVSAPHTPRPTSTFTATETAPLVPSLATFLLTLFAYNVNPSIARFRASLAALLGRCPACVRGYVAAKRALEDQYLRDQSADRVAAFMRTLTQWEAGLLGDAATAPRWTDVLPTVRLLVVLDSALAGHPDVGRVIDTELAAQAASPSVADASAGVDYGSLPVFGEGLLPLLLPVRTGSSTGSTAPDPVVGFARTLLPPRGTIAAGQCLVDSLPSLERLLSLATSPQTATSPAGRDIWRALHDLLTRLAPSALDALLTGGDGSLQVERNERWLDDHCAGGTGEAWAGLVGTLCSKLGLSSATGTDAASQTSPAYNVDEGWLENLRCFALVLRQAQSALWLPPKNGWLAVMRGRRAPDPLGVLDSITGSHALLTRLSTQPAPSTAEINASLAIFLPLIRSLLRPKPAPPAKAGLFDPKGKGKEAEVVVLEPPEAAVDEYEALNPLVGAEAVKKAVWFLCENLQHPRFGIEVRTAAMTEGIKVRCPGGCCARRLFLISQSR